MPTTKRGPYAKGIARRREILEQALAAYAEADAAGPSLRTIAERVGLSERGLLHYFASRDELLVAILAERDADDRRLFPEDGPLSSLAAVPARASRTPGLVRLFGDMAAASPDPEHAAHAFFVRRYRELRARIVRMLARDAEAGPVAPSPAVDAEFVARILIAASDGLQQQWLLDPTIDLERDLGALGALLERGTVSGS